MLTLSAGFKKCLPYFAIFALALSAYANTFGNDFIWDDEYLITHNSQIKNIANITRIFGTNAGYGSENANNFYRPMQELSDLADYSVWKLNPAGYHITNTVLHALVSILVY
ncbi:MAG: hypothetical protein HQL28_06795, partial [Candidatus Omnitrophica bacterium]|nr:hypothetical protein [Candidatus Omnitrophota bacterium]